MNTEELKDALKEAESRIAALEQRLDELEAVLATLGE